MICLYNYVHINGRPHTDTQMNKTTTFRETLPEPLLALLWGQLVERLGLLLPQKGFVVIVKVVAVVVVPVTEKLIVMNPVLLLRGLAGGVHHTEGKAHHKGPQLHLLYPQEQGGTGYLVIVVYFIFFLPLYNTFIIIEMEIELYF